MAHTLDPPNPLPHLLLEGQQAATGGASANGNIIGAYRDGISLVDEPGAMTGFLAIVGSIGFALCGWINFDYLSRRGIDWFSAVTLIGIGLSVAMLRTDLLGHTYSPVLFDRAARKVHVFVSLPPRWWQLWKWWPSSRVESYDWSCIRAELVEVVHVGGVGVPRKNFALTLAVTETPGSTRVRARFGVGLGYPWAPEPILALWEHLRRFMTGHGPHLAAGDSVYLNPHHEGFWRSLGFMQPLLMPGAKGWLTGSDFSGHWWFTLPFSFFCLLLLPFTAACGLIRWLAIQARREPRWPDHIAASIGEPIDLAVPRMTWAQRRKAAKRQSSNSAR